jgi:hypothetical protein
VLIVMAGRRIKGSLVATLYRSPHAGPRGSRSDARVWRADWYCIVRKFARVADGRVKPDHDGGREFGIFGAWYWMPTALNACYEPEP